MKSMKQVLAIIMQAAIALAVGLALTQSVYAVDNTGTGGVITYTDSNGSNAVASPPYANGYVVHTFTNSGTLNIPTAVSNANVLVVAGGGVGGHNGGGGGGAGGVIYTNGYPLVGGSNYTVTVGAGAVSLTYDTNWTTKSGSNSVFGALTAIGGGGGASRDYGPASGASGGSGGGGGGGAGRTTAGTSNAAGQGNNGGIGVGGSGYGGGGGGAGSPGTAGGSNPRAGDGGTGVYYAAFAAVAGSPAGWFGGGGAGQQCPGLGSANGLGGTNGGGGAVGQAGVANTGGGGGGNGAKGGSGIVIVRYPYAVLDLSVSVTAPANGRQFLPGSSVTATVMVANGTMPYTVTFYTNSAVAWSTNNASTTLFTIDLGALADGTYTNYATVTDNVSSNATSATNTFTVAPDTTAPTPDPMTFAVVPSPLSSNSIVMTATTASDVLSPPVQYCFTNTVNGNNSGWIPGTIWTNTGLTKGTTYGYQVKARDTAAVPNETAFSGVFTAVPAEPTVAWDANNTGAGQTDGNGTWLNANQWWDGAVNCNWNNGIPNNAVIGNGGAGVNGTITLGAVTAGSVTFTNFSGTYTLSGGSLSQGGGITIATNAGNVTLSTGISGAGGITKNGPGKLQLFPGNSFTGPIIVKGGVVQFGNWYGNSWGEVGSIPGNLEINGGTVSAYYYGSRSLGSGAGQIQITGGRSGFSNMQGDAGGNMWTVNADANYEVVWGSTYFNPSTFVLNDNAAAPTCFFKIPNKFDLNGADRTIECSAASVGGILTGVIRNSSGTAGITKIGAGDLQLWGANIYNGGVTINGGTLTLGNVSALGSSAGPVTFTGTSTLNLATVSPTVGSLSSASGYGIITASGAVTLTVSQTNTTTYSGVIQNGSGTVSLLKTGSGTLTLSGANTYSGATKILDGTLFGVTGGSCSNSSVTVTNTTGITAALGIVVTNTAQPWVCSNLTVSAVAGGAAQVKFSFSVTPSLSQAPLVIRNTVAFSGSTTIVVDSANLQRGKKVPLLTVGGTPPGTVPTLIMTGMSGILGWEGNTLYLTIPSAGTLLMVE